MRGPRVAAAVLVVAALLLGTQLAFTTVGQELGQNWNGPTEVANIQSSQQVLITDIAADGGETGGAVAWIEKFGSRYTVHVATFTAEHERITMGETTRVAVADREFVSVDVARSGEDLAVVWEVPVEDRVHIARVSTGTVERATAADSFRLHGPRVTYAGRAPLVTWTGQRGVDDEFAVYAARPGGEPVRVGGRTHREHAPTVSASGGHAAVTWFDPENDTAIVTRLRAGERLAVNGSTVLGEARVQGSFGGSRRAVPFFASTQNRSTIRAVWTDIGEVTTATVDADGTVTSQRTLTSFGGELGVGARGNRWLVTWTVPGGPTNDDVFFIDGEGRRGTLVRLPSNENEPTPVYAPDPAVAWYSWGDRSRVLLAAHRPGGSSGAIYRLSTAPQRFAFLSISALALGVVTLPIMPWSFVGFFAAFLVTTGTIGGRILGAAGRLSGANGVAELREQVRALPTITWPIAFALVEIPFTWWVVFEWTQLTSLGFAHPLAASLGALVAALAVVTLLEVRSGWWAIAGYVVLQNAALWSIAGTMFL